MPKERDKEKEKEKDSKAETLNHLSIHQWVRSLCHFCATATHLSYRFPIFETSATALCGTTGKLGEVISFTIMSTRHLDDNERTSLALELMSFKIKYFYLSKAQIILRIEGVDVEVLRNLFHCSTTYLPFGQRQQSSQVVLGQVKPMHNNWYCMNVYYSPVGSMPLFPLQIARSKVASYVDSADDIAGTELGYSLTKDYSASRFEFRTVIDDNNSYTSMITFWVPRSVNFSFPRDHYFIDKNGKKISFTIEHCGNILPHSGAPGEPPKHETKKEHWRRVGEKRNPSYKNRLTVIAPVSSQSSPQKRRFGLLKESFYDGTHKQVSYTYAEETYPWVLFLDVLLELDSFDTFMTLFGQFENVFSTQGEFQKQSNSGLEATSKQPRIISFHLASGRHFQLNRVEGKDSSPYLTKVDALQILPFTS